MLAHMHHGIHARDRAQIGIIGDIAMRRHKVQRVVSLFRVDIIAARGLDTDERFAKPHQGQRKGIKLPRKIRIVFRCAPARLDLRLNRKRKFSEQCLVLIERNGFANFPSVARGIGGASHQGAHERIAIGSISPRDSLLPPWRATLPPFRLAYQAHAIAKRPSRFG
ncbi:Uncharacterised protein [Brucella melitensis]|nr:Uncharacterised protein [Brucella melitensis]